eukprot:891124-Pelagomonas_calceolata.AAC.2
MSACIVLRVERLPTPPSFHLASGTGVARPHSQAGPGVLKGSYFLIGVGLWIVVAKGSVIMCFPPTGRNMKVAVASVLGMAEKKEKEKSTQATGHVH